jgi:class 3 adenylate cyclase
MLLDEDAGYRTGRGAYVAAIDHVIVRLAVDVVDHSRLVEAGAEGTLKRLEADRDQLLHPIIAEHSGHVVKTTGDRLLAEFTSPIEAVQCAVQIQRRVIAGETGTPPDRRIRFRIGIHLIDKTAGGDDFVSRAVAALSVNQLTTLIKPENAIYGDGSEIAVRLAALADPGRIYISEAARDAVGDRLPYRFEDIGEQNIYTQGALMRCFAVNPESGVLRSRVAVQNRRGSAGRISWFRRGAAGTSLVAACGICAVAVWAWLSASSSVPPIPAHMPAVSATAVTNAQAPSEASVPSETAADRDTQPLPAAQSPFASGPAGDKSPQASPAPLSLSDLGAAVIRGKQAPSTPQTTLDSSAAVIRGTQAVSAVPVPDSGPSVVRGR